jgi:hypothetical protein
MPTVVQINEVGMGVWAASDIEINLVQNPLTPELGSPIPDQLADQSLDLRVGEEIPSWGDILEGHLRARKRC